MKLKYYIRKCFYGEGVNPLPLVVVAVIFGTLFCNAMTMTMVFSFLPKLVKSFGISEANTGYYAGFIASSLFVGRALFSLLWGVFADTKGKKNALLFALSGLLLSTLAFGFSFNFYWAFTTRFLQGALMGVVVVTKSIMADLCDDTNVALGMSSIVAAFSTGLIIGPSLAGFLVFPAEQYPNVFAKDSFFGRFGILIPNLVIVIGLALGIVSVIIYIPNDKKKKTGERSYLLGSQQHNKNDVTTNDNNMDDYDNYSIDRRTRIIEEESNNNHFYTFHLNESIHEIAPTGNCCKNIISKKAMKSTKIWKLLRTKECILSSILYGTYSVAAIGYDEMFPLFAATSKVYNGFGFTTSEIGIALLAMSTFLLIFQIVILSKIARKFGPRKVFIWCTLIMTFCIPLIPTLAAIRNKILFWFLLILVLLICRTCVAGAFLAVNILVNNSVTADLLGSANGLGMTLSSVGRTAAPSLFGSTFAWSLKNIKEIEGNDGAIGFPFNQYFAFFMLSVISLLNAIFASQLPATMDVKKVEVKKVKEEDNAVNEIEQIINSGRTTKLTVSVFRPEF